MWVAGPAWWPLVWSAFTFSHGFIIWEPNSGKRLLTLAGKADVSTATGKAGSRSSSPMKRIESGAGGLIMSKEEAMGAAEIEKLRKTKLRQRDEEIKMLKKHIGQVRTRSDGCSIHYSLFLSKWGSSAAVCLEECVMELLVE